MDKFAGMEFETAIGEGKINDIQRYRREGEWNVGRLTPRNGKC